MNIMSSKRPSLGQKVAFTLEDDSFMQGPVIQIKYGIFRNKYLIQWELITTDLGREISRKNIARWVPQNRIVGVIVEGPDEQKRQV